MDIPALNSVRESILAKLKLLFNDKAIEAHIFGSTAREETDAFSDIDIWYTFKDEEFADVYEKRFDYYERLGTIIHRCEPPQNAPIGGVHTVLLIKTNEALTIVDVYLCPLSTAYVTKEARKLFGVDLPVGVIGFNPQKVQVNEDYRIDFFICFIFNTIKKLIRHEENPLSDVLREYENLYKNYAIQVAPLTDIEQGWETLKRMIENTQKISNERQKEVLATIYKFALDVAIKF